MGHQQELLTKHLCIAPATACQALLRFLHRSLLPTFEAAINATPRAACRVLDLLHGFLECEPQGRPAISVASSTSTSETKGV